MYIYTHILHTHILYILSLLLVFVFFLNFKKVLLNMRVKNSMFILFTLLVFIHVDVNPKERRSRGSCRHGRKEGRKEDVLNFCEQSGSFSAINATRNTIRFCREGPT